MAKHFEKGVVWSEREKDIPHLIGVFILGVQMEGMEDVINPTAECNLKTNKISWDRMRKYYISLPNFKLSTEEPSDEEIWIQTIKNLGTMVNIDPKIYDRADDELKALIDKARVSALSDEEYRRYEAELKILSDEGTAERYGYDRGVMDGMEKGIAAERHQIIANLRQAGFSDEYIADITKIPLEELKRI